MVSAPPYHICILFLFIIDLFFILQYLYHVPRNSKPELFGILDPAICSELRAKHYFAFPKKIFSTTALLLSSMLLRNMTVACKFLDAVFKSTPLYPPLSVFPSIVLFTSDTINVQEVHNIFHAGNFCCKICLSEISSIQKYYKTT